MQKGLLIASLMVMFFLGGCSAKRFSEIADVRQYSQNPLDYVNKGSTDKNLTFVKFTKEELITEFDTRYFAPWSLAKPPFDLQQAKWPWQTYGSHNTFKENTRSIEEDWFKQMLLEANFEEFGKVSKAGIVIHVSNMRNFPSDKPVFKDFELAGEGYPFDYNQNSLTTANEPIFISHYSKSKAWVYVSTSYTSGWVPAHNVALISPDIIQKWSQARQAILLEDGVPLYDLNKEFVANSRIGMMLPVMKVENDAFQAILATDQTGGYVTFTVVRIPKNLTITAPMALDKQSIAIMAKAFMGDPYGWGGLYENRDCSSMLRDLYKPFSLWLPRNSKEQSKVGQVYDLSKLNPKEKERAIIDNAIPFETLLYKPGHIMLYVGEDNGKALILHNMWGVTTKSKNIEMRNVVGRTVITTLMPGKELSGYVKKDALVAQIESMNIITAKSSGVPIILAPQVEEKKARTRRSSRDKEEGVQPQEVKPADAVAAEKPLATDIQTNGQSTAPAKADAI